LRGLFASLVLFAMALPSATFAQGTEQQRSDCMGDAFRFCSSDIPFVSEIEACLQANLSRLSPACRSEFAPSSTTRLRPEHFR
jgi:hypothetical protein